MKGVHYVYENRMLFLAHDHPEIFQVPTQRAAHVVGAVQQPVQHQLLETVLVDAMLARQLDHQF
jgi:hypothetical protein